MDDLDQLEPELQYSEKYQDDDYNPYGSSQATTEPEGIRELKALTQFSNQIVSEAISVYRDLDRQDEFGRQKALKKDKRLRRIFICLYMAYNRLGFPVDPKYLIQQLGYGVKCNFDKAVNENNLNLIIDPVRLAEFYLKRLVTVSNYNLDIPLILQEVSTLLEECRGSEIGRDYIDNTPAKVISIGAICYVLTYIHDEYDKFKLKLATAWYLSPSCVRKYRDKISEIYNDAGHKVTYESWLDNL
ncbi:MAG: hypothetical protein ACYCQJ_15730 [Nitrososphaerales archaeon]